MKRSSFDSLSRRRVLQGMSAALGAAAIGCGSGAADQEIGPPVSGGAGGAGGGSSGGSDGGAGGAGGEGAGGPISACEGGGGLSSEELLAPIETIVVLCMENRSFDHYLGSLRLVEGLDVIGLTGTESNPAPNGSKVDVFNLNDFTPADPPHTWDPSHKQWNGGANDGFVIAHEGASQNDVMGYHVREQIPITYAIADASAICHRYFASVLGPTWPNRFYLHGASSKGQKGNFPIFGGFKSIWDLLSAAGISAKNYFHDVAWCSGAFFKQSGVVGIEKFFADAAAGTLPQFSIIDPQFFGAGANDDHPDHDVQLGQALISTVFTALAKGPQWSRCLFVLTYDEHGGFFDHVAPPSTFDENGEFKQLGFRVPTLVAGPFVRRGCAVDTTLEHVSIIKTLTKRFKLPSLSGRVDAANDLSSTLNPLFFDKPQPAPEMPPIKISMSRLRSRAVHREHHPEMWEAAERGIIPRHLDRRSAGLGACEHVLAWGEKLGTLRI